MKKAYLLFSVVLIAFASSSFAESNDAQASYCKYIMEQAEAERDILRTPSAVVGPTQPSTGTPAQIMFGMSSSVADIKKSGLTMNAARTTCKLYGAATEAQQHIYYALPLIEKDAVRHRLQLIQEASEQLDAMEAKDSKLVEVQNLTRQDVYHLQSARTRLDMSRASILTGATFYVPELSNTPLRVLIGDKLNAEEANQKALVQLTKQKSWDVQLSAGGRRQLGDVNSNISPAGAYGTFSFTYNLSRQSADRHLDNSVSAYTDWKKSQVDDVAHQALLLKKQIEASIEIQKEQLRRLTEHDTQLTKDIASLDQVETGHALSFRNQLVADQVILRVDVGDIQFRLAQLQQYLADNF